MTSSTRFGDVILRGTSCSFCVHTCIVFLAISSEDFQKYLQSFLQILRHFVNI